MGRVEVVRGANWRLRFFHFIKEQRSMKPECGDAGGRTTDGGFCHNSTDPGRRCDDHPIPSDPAQQLAEIEARVLRDLFTPGPEFAMLRLKYMELRGNPAIWSPFVRGADVTPR